MLDECACRGCADDLLIPQLPPIQTITDAPPSRVRGEVVPITPGAFHARPLHPVDPETWKPEPGRMLPRTILAFTGLAGSGKSTAAHHLVEQGWQRVRFAGPLKDMMRALGLTEAEIEGDRKEVPCDLLGGKTPRWAMQSIGTEWGRDLIAKDLWIRAWRAALNAVPAGVPVVVDDCRFPNEAEAVQAAGGHLIKVVRPGAGAGAAGHSSEAYTLPFNIEVHNDTAVADFLARVDRAVMDLSWIDVTPLEQRAG